MDLIKRSDVIDAINLSLEKYGIFCVDEVNAIPAVSGNSDTAKKLEFEALNNEQSNKAILLEGSARIAELEAQLRLQIKECQRLNKLLEDEK